MKILHPSPRQAAAIVQAMYAVATAGGRVAITPLEIDCISAIQCHMLALAEPLEGRPGPLPDDLETVLDSDLLRRQTVRFLTILPLIDRRVLPEKVALVETAARRLGIDEHGLRILRRAAKGQFKRIAMLLMKRFVDWWAPGEKARLRDWVSFFWWMMPQLHGAEMTRRTRALTERYRALAALPEGTVGHTLHRFYETYEIALPGEPKSVPWSMHEVYHVLSEYGVALEAELLLTAFVGGTQEATCLDQILFGLLSYHVGKQIVGGVVSEGLLDPDEYFRAMARGAAINVDLVNGWSLWDVAEIPMADLRARYNLPPISADERSRIMAYNGLLTGPGHSTPLPA
jgi:hypothetical protein